MKTTLEDMFIDMSARDYSQYKNIMHTFDPEIKSIILCGHGHGMSKAYGGWRTLATWMKRHPNIHIISIENSEAITQSNPQLNKLMQVFGSSEPYVLWDNQERNYFSEPRYDPILELKIDALWDATILYPINSSLNKTWKSFNDQRDLLKISVKNINLKTPFVIYTFLESEMNSENPIPTSSQFVTEKDSDIELYWIPKTEKIIIWDGTKKIPYPNN